MITKYRKVKIKGKEICQLVFNKTPFYAESGGQTGDTGLITSENEKIAITDTIKENNLIIHIAKNLPSDPSVVFKASVDNEKRLMTANNHYCDPSYSFCLKVGTWNTCRTERVSRYSRPSTF